jgi:exopolysaccharide biosynthesis polyprenyl glycosylphosphotransferase
MKSNGSLVYSFSLLVGDLLALFAAFALAYFIRGPLSSVPVAHPIEATTYLWLFMALAPFWLLIFALLGLYNSSIYEQRFREAGRLLIGSFVGLLFVSGWAYFDNRPIFPAKLVPIYGFVLAFFLLLFFRNFIRGTRSLLFNYGRGITKVLIIGNTPRSLELLDLIEDSRVSGYQVVGVIAGKNHSSARYPHIPLFANFADAMTKLKPRDLHSIVQTELYASAERNDEVLEYAQTHHLSYRFVPGNSELFVGNIDVELFRGSIPVIAVHQTPLIGWGRIIKRMTDVVLGSVMLVIAIPFMALIAIVEKLSDIRAPILYKELRLTRFNNPIKIYKFRSMKRVYNGMSPEAAFTKMGHPELIKPYREGGDQLPNDPRISRLGGFLRSSSLDELPQLWNVLKGEISLVGPRALYAPELEKYDKKDILLAVKSGLTGLAQVSGRRDISFAERRRLDLYYVQNWSLWLDLVIIAKTVRVVLRRIGAR